MVAASSLYGVTDTKSELALDLPVDKQDNQRTNHRHDKAAEIKTIYTAKAEESTNPTPTTAPMTPRITVTINPPPSFPA